MSKEDLITKLEEIMETDEGILNENTILADVEEWDSLSKLSLMAFVKKEFSISLTANQIKEFITVADICNTLL